MIVKYDRLYLYTERNSNIDLGGIEQMIAPYAPKQLDARVSADGAMDIYQWELGETLTIDTKQTLITGLLPLVRSQSCAVYLRSKDAQAIKRIVSDLDGTLVRDELLVALVRGKAQEEMMKAETEHAMSGHCAFEENFRHRVQWLRGLGATTLEEFAYQIPLTKGAELFSYFVQGEELRFDLASSNLAPYVHNMCIRLNANEYIASMPLLEDDDETLTGALEEAIIGAKEKRQFAEKDPHARVSSEATLTIGDGANDIEMLSATGHALLYCSLVSQPLDIAHISTDIYFQ